MLISSVSLHTITDHLPPTWSVCITLSPTSNADLLNPYADQLKHITNQKRSRNKNHGEKRLTSMSTVEHSPMHVLNAVKAKLQSTMQGQTRGWRRRQLRKKKQSDPIRGKEEESRERRKWGGIGCTVVWEKKKRNGGVAHLFKKNTQGYFCPLT